MYSIWNNNNQVVSLFSRSITFIESCSICLADLNGNICLTKCKHTFHRRCLHKWLRTFPGTFCPKCREPLTLPLSYEQIKDVYTFKLGGLDSDETETDTAEESYTDKDEESHEESEDLDAINDNVIVADNATTQGNGPPLFIIITEVEESDE
ncbi:E3 ubiquitin-protein ligase TRAIP-like [Harmonia axyridis]|uniref:E3 ubiquitin-protein ligase TRAIP-like n=1 Tax=Harmonia axyridis TaxID=115357 RepID=UPI001E277955|nr:E3 ubiquitin-protein ligase TRAIP-like [Harmonia axyridis]